MYEHIVTASMIVVAVIHLLPIAGVISAEQLASLYDVEIAEPNLEVLVRHRAVLFGLLGGLFLYSAFTPSIQPIAFVLALFSITSFFFLTWSVGKVNAKLQRVVYADIVAAFALVVAVVCYQLQQG
jgi:hypothetical protein